MTSPYKKKRGLKIAKKIKKQNGGTIPDVQRETLKLTYGLSDKEVDNV